MHANVSSALIYIGHRVGPSTRSIRQLLEAPKWNEGPKILEKKGFKAKKKKGFKWIYKNPAHHFDQKTKFLLYPLKHW